MNSKIFKFPSMRFYDESLTNHPVIGQNRFEVKTRVRKMTLEIYNIRGPLDKNDNPSSKDALFFVRNVMQSVARHEKNDTFLQNFANANAIHDQIRILNRYDVTTDQITILIVYRDQIKIIVHKIRSKLQADGITLNKFYSKVIIIDSYQDKKNEIVILNIVAVNPKTGMYAFEIDDLSKDLNEKDAADSLEKKIFRRYDIFFSHVKDRSRLNVDLTRARFCLIIIVQVGGALWTSRAGKIGKRKKKSDLAALMQYATRERIIYDDRDFVNDYLDTQKTMLQILFARDKKFKTYYELSFISKRIAEEHRDRSEQEYFAERGESTRIQPESNPWRIEFRTSSQILDPTRRIRVESS